MYTNREALSRLRPGFSSSKERGAAACLLPLRSATHAGIGLLSQAVATALVWAVVVPVLAGGAPVVGELAWAYPVGTLRVRLDALGAFFLAWSLPMTLLGSIYAWATWESIHFLGVCSAAK